jgi:hypothetical protein
VDHPTPLDGPRRNADLVWTEDRNGRRNSLKPRRGQEPSCPMYGERRRCPSPARPEKSTGHVGPPGAHPVVPRGAAGSPGTSATVQRLDRIGTQLVPLHVATERVAVAHALGDQGIGTPRRVVCGAAVASGGSRGSRIAYAASVGLDPLRTTLVPVAVATRRFLGAHAVGDRRFIAALAQMRFTTGVDRIVVGPWIRSRPSPRARRTKGPIVRCNKTSRARTRSLQPQAGGIQEPS